MRPRRLGAAWVLAALGLASAAHADCGEEQCGPHGACDDRALLARCDCDPGYFSLRVHLGEASLGAYCVAEPVLPGVAGCDPSRCEPHGTCWQAPAADAGTATCICDPGYRLDESGGCEDDPNDDAEAVCEGVRCGEGNACLPTPQGPTCRCLTGGAVVLGSADDEKFGPVCNERFDPRMACGPDGCGPYGECIVSQISRCKCDDGANVQILPAPNGEEQPYCVDPERPPPNVAGGTPPLDAGAAGSSEPLADAAVGGSDSVAVEPEPPDASTGDERPTSARGCGCRAASRSPARPSLVAALLALVCAVRTARTRRRVDKVARPGTSALR